MNHWWTQTSITNETATKRLATEEKMRTRVSVVFLGPRPPNCGHPKSKNVTPYFVTSVCAPPHVFRLSEGGKCFMIVEVTNGSIFRAFLYEGSHLQSPCAERALEQQNYIWLYIPFNSRIPTLSQYCHMICIYYIYNNKHDLLGCHAAIFQLNIWYTHPILFV